jgi:hypothetical protein
LIKPTYIPPHLALSQTNQILGATGPNPNPNAHHFTSSGTGNKNKITRLGDKDKEKENVITYEPTILGTLIVRPLYGHNFPSSSSQV